MTFFSKSILAMVLLALAAVNLFVMLELLGRTGERRFDHRTLRLIHRVCGYLLLVLFIYVSYVCLHIMRGMEDEPGARAALHGVFAVGAFLVLGLKLVLVRYYRKYYALAVPLGLTVFVLLAMTVATSAGYYFAMRGVHGPAPLPADTSRDAAAGAALFARLGCGDCHYLDRTDSKFGPGLMGLYAGQGLPSSGQPVTDANVILQLREPLRVMPAYPHITAGELQALLAFMRQL